MTQSYSFKDFHIGSCVKDARVAVLKNNRDNGELLCLTAEFQTLLLLGYRFYAFLEFSSGLEISPFCKTLKFV